MCAGSFVRRGCELMNYGNCLSLRGGLIIRKRAIGVAILANVLGTVRTKSVGAHLKANLSARHGVRFARLDVGDRDSRRWQEQLFRKVLDRYVDGPLAYGRLARHWRRNCQTRLRSSVRKQISVANMRPPEMRTNTPTLRTFSRTNRTENLPPGALENPPYGRWRRHRQRS